MTFRFSLFGREVFAIELFGATSGGPEYTAEFDEAGDLIRLGAYTELADDEPAFEDRLELPYGFSPPNETD
ncbi:Hypothetical protein AJAP_28085 [Amycolatopsis japonica]|uniref:Uncharacterized protein n=1 Tax=Amycolatopsis japonica TaxID=208439 RepID=A0A075V6A7_9PSEU|nr:hypothetical protein [Amycolatopsis japonica]AIG78455.1 Hypothetical protein AJAP_28085 [Amycolatopsis japonica]